MQNIHLEHPEDSVFTGDLSVLNWFTAKSYISIKIDGSPAIVWGTNPKTGNFFVGTKSVFNKRKIMINESHEDIDQNHGHLPKVARILHNCFDNLPRTHRILQGDFLGYGGDNVYQPNTIAYAFPHIIEQNVIIAPNTEYVKGKWRDEGYDLRGSIKKPLYGKLDSTDEVLFWHPDVTIKEHRDDIEDLCNFARQMSTLCKFVDDKEAAQLKVELNARIREGIEIDDDVLEEIAFDREIDINVLRLWQLVRSIKCDLFAYISEHEDVECYIMGEDLGHEGYVMHNEFGSFKIVNRGVFSYANFVIEKIR